MIRISVVTPSSNQGPFIERTIRSVLDQAYPELDYVVCDGCSSDETSHILEKYTGRLRVIREPDDGQADAVNKGIRVTAGDVIGWLNSDDVYRPGALFTVAAYFARHPEVDVLYGDATIIDADDRLVGRYYTEPWNPQRLVYRPYICQPAAFFRRRVVDRYGPLDRGLQYTLDYEYWLRLAQCGASFVYFPAILSSTREHPGTKTRTRTLSVHDELNVMLKRYVKNVPDNWLLTQTHTILQKRATNGGFSSPLGFALGVAIVSLRLSLEVNRSISPGMLVSTARTVAAGVLKAGLGLPVTMPLK